MAPDQLEEIKRHFGVVAEALRSDIRRMPKVTLSFAMNSRNAT